MKRLAAVGLLTTFLTAPAAHAGLIDFSIGGGGWDIKPTGNISYTNGGTTGTDIDLQNDLGLKSKTQTYLWADLEHPLPVLPNIRLGYSTLKTTGDNVVTRSITYGGNTYTTGTRVVTDAKVNQTDLVLYYSPLNNWVKLDLGLDLKYLDMDFKLSDSSQTTQAKGSAVVPMLYGNLGFEIPATSLSLGVSGSYIGYSKSSFSDVRARVAYVFGDHIGIEGGYRQVQLKIDSSSIDTNGDIKFGGSYLGLFAKF